MEVSKYYKHEPTTKVKVEILIVEKPCVTNGQG